MPDWRDHVDRLGPDDTLVRFGGPDTGVTLSLTDRALRRLTDAPAR
ncbi:hypothetical protein AB0I60_28800 [Actinosynnema sp. NPDC050436]